MNPIETLINGIESTYNQAVLDNHVRRFQDDPLYALEWSSDAFREAASKAVAQECLSLIERAQKAGRDVNQIHADLLEYCLSHTIRGAQSVEHSTSAPSNLVQRYKLQAWGRMAERFRA